MKLTPQQKRNLIKNTKDKPTGIKRINMIRLLDKIIASPDDGEKWDIVKANAMEYRSFIF